MVVCLRKQKAVRINGKLFISNWKHDIAKQKNVSLYRPHWKTMSSNNTRCYLPNNRSPLDWMKNKKPAGVFSLSRRPAQISQHEFPDVVTRYAKVLLKLNLLKKNLNLLTVLKSTPVETVGPRVLGLLCVFNPTLPQSWRAWPLPPLHRTPEKTQRKKFSVQKGSIWRSLSRTNFS